MLEALWSFQNKSCLFPPSALTSQCACTYLYTCSKKLPAPTPFWRPTPRNSLCSSSWNSLSLLAPMPNSRSSNNFSRVKKPRLKRSTASPAPRQQHCTHGQRDSIPFLLCWSTLQGSPWEKGLHRASRNRQLFHFSFSKGRVRASQKVHWKSPRSRGFPPCGELEIKLHGSRNGYPTAQPCISHLCILPQSSDIQKTQTHHSQGGFLWRRACLWFSELFLSFWSST